MARSSPARRRGPGRRRRPGVARRSQRTGIAWLALTAACGGGATYDGSVYRDAEARFRVDAPGDGWNRVHLDEETDLAFHHPRWDAVLQINASCDPALDIPLQALTNQMLAGFTERSFAAQEVVPFDGREAMRSRVVAKLDGVPRELALAVAKKDGCVYDLVLAAPPGEGFAGALPAYEAVLESFHAPTREATGSR